MVLLDGSGGLQDFLGAGFTPDEARRLWELPEGSEFIEYLGAIPGPLRVGDLAAHMRSMGLPEFRPPVPVSSFLAAPIRHGGVGNIYVAKSDPGQEFSQEDEETLVMFASQVALVIANARRHRDERRARANLETLIDTSPIGVVVFDARTAAPVSINRETRRILEKLTTAEQDVEQLLEVLTFRRCRRTGDLPGGVSAGPGAGRGRGGAGRGDRHYRPRRPERRHAGQRHAHPLC